MPGENSNPYRLPCWLASWPTRQWLTFCAQHAQSAHMSIDEACNAAIDDATPTYATTCAEGTPVNGNCYGECEVSDATGVTISGSYAVGETVLALAGGCGKIAAWDRIQFSDDENIYTVKATVETICPASLAGYGLEINEPGLFQALDSGATVTILPRGTRDYSQCEFEGWFAVRARKLWHGRNGWLSGCAACDDSTIHYRRIERTATYTQVRFPVTGECAAAAKSAYESCYTGCDGDADCASDCAAEYMSAMELCASGGAETLASYNWHRIYEVSTTGELSEIECSDSDGDLGLTFDNSKIAALVMYGNWNCGPDFDPTHLYGDKFNDWFDFDAEPVIPPDIEFTVAIIQETNTVIEIEVTGSTYETGYFYTNTWHATWTLSAEYQLASVVSDAYGLADMWDISDFVQCPPRTPGSWLLEPEGIYHSPIPFVQIREVGPISPDVASVCGGFPVCGGFTEWAASCPFDGVTIGAPLPNGTGPHYGFYDANEHVESLGWNPGFGLPIGATWWTKMDGLENNAANWPAGGWVRVEESVVTVQKWMETKNEDASHNFFRPCGQDDRDIWGADYRVICGRLAIASMTLDAGTHVLSVVLADGADVAMYSRIGVASITRDSGTAIVSVVLSEPATGLVVGDRIDFVSYGAAPDYDETVDNGASKNIPDTAGYGIATMADSTHFTVIDMMVAPSATYIKVHGAPRITAGDKLDFVKYGAAPTFAETVDNGGSKITPDTAGYIVSNPTDPTHFTISGIASVPDATHVKSHGAPHFQWNDDRRKGDFVWCKEETECIGVTGETTDNACEAGCLPFSPCYPAVAAVLTPDAPEDFGNADVQTLPAEPGNTYRLLWKPRMDEDDLLGGEGRVESMCEPPAGAPTFPSGVAFSGCGTLPAFRPMRGLGDVVARIAQPIARHLDKLTSKLPVKLRTNVAGCGGCKKRQAALNKAVPFKRKTTL